MTRLTWAVVLVAWAAVTTVAATAHAQESDLRVEQTAPAEADADTDVTFELSVTNGGPDQATVVTLDDPLPAGMTFVSMAAAANSICTTPAVGAGGTVHCALPTLDAAMSAAFTVVAHIDANTPAGTYFSNIATVTNAVFDPTSENDSAVAVVQTPPPPLADVGVTKTGPSATNPDLDVTYTITVQNGGPGDATNVALVESVPGSMTVVSFVQDSGPAFACSSGAGGETCTLASMSAGAVATFTMVGHVPLATGDGTTFQNFATVTSDYDPNTENDASTSLLCVQADSCAAGGCNNNVAVVCPSAGQCEDQSSCDPVTGACPPNPPKPNATGCDDGDACTQSDACQAGVCTGANPVVCPVAGACENQGACDPGTGTCAANTAAADGTACDDGDGCTQSDSCQVGVCTGSQPVTCPAPGQCEDQGACVPATGLCAANPPKADGIACDDGDACTDADVCASGACGGGTHDCSDGDDCTIDSCDPATGCHHTGMCVEDEDAGGLDAGSDAGGVDAGGVMSDGGSAGSRAPGLRPPTLDSGASGAAGASAGAGGGPATKDSGASEEDAGLGLTGGGGCDCRVANGDAPRRAGWSLLLAACALLRLTRRRAQRAMRTRGPPPT